MRVFFAVSLPASARDAVGRALSPVVALAPSLRWEPTANLHITLRFVGDVDALQMPALVEAPLPPLPAITLGGGGVFPHRERPEVLWIGVHSALEPVAEAVDAAVRRLGHPPDRLRFRPHLTVGRVPPGNDPGRAISALLALGDLCTFRPTAVTLYESSRQGYRAVAIARTEE